MKNCYFCHKPVGIFQVKLTIPILHMHTLEYTHEDAHLECLEHARFSFEKEGDAA